MTLIANSYYRGMSLLSLLMALSLLSAMILSVGQWQAHQRKTSMEIYQRYQAIQIAENQKQRLFLGLACEQKVIQNQLSFQVECQDQQVKIYYLEGKKQITL